MGFTFWQLRQDRETQFAITAPDYATEDFVDATTDDLTLALWIEAAQADTLSRADVDGAPIDMAMGVTFTKATLTVVERGRTDELVLVRRPSTSEHDSGWLVRTAEKSFLRNKEVEILAGLLVQTAAYLVPLLALPTGTMARVADGRFLGALGHAGHRRHPSPMRTGSCSTPTVAARVLPSASVVRRRHRPPRRSKRSSTA